jgi:hypothetical protein
VQVTALLWNRRLAGVEQLLEDLLFLERIHERHGGHDVLGFDDAPAPPGVPA